MTIFIHRARNARPSPSLRMALAACLLAAWAALPAAADWLVTADGQKVETAGPWKVQGKLVVFKRPNGTLSSIRLSEVDLEASRLATDEAARPVPPPPPPAPKQPVMVLTDADVPHVTPEGEALGEEAGAEAAEAPPAAAPADGGGLEVTEWRQLDDPENLDVQIMGTVTNTSRDLVTDVTVTVRLLGSGGSLIAEKPASLSPNTLAAGAAVNFRAVFPGVVSFSSASFSVKGGVRARPIGAVTPPAPPEAR